MKSLVSFARSVFAKHRGMKKKLPTATSILRDLLIVENFVGEEVCCELIRTHDRFGSLNAVSDNGLNLAEMQTQDPDVFRLAKTVVLRMIDMIDRHFRESVACDLALICAISGTFRHRLHADNALVVCPRHGDDQERLVNIDCQCEDIEVRPNHTAWRKYTGLLYLDSDHDGGNISFGEGPNVFGKVYRKQIEVRRGLLVLSPSSELYYHRTEPVTRGTRYSMNVWFTTERSRMSRGWH